MFWEVGLPVNLASLSFHSSFVTPNWELLVEKKQYQISNDTILGALLSSPLLLLVMQYSHIQIRLTPLFAPRNYLTFLNSYHLNFKCLFSPMLCLLLQLTHIVNVIMQT